MTRRLLLLAGLAALLAACGRKGPLEPPPSGEDAADEEARDY